VLPLATASRCASLSTRLPSPPQASPLQPSPLQAFGVTIALALTLTACAKPQPQATPQPSQTSDLQAFSRVTLSQPDQKGNPAWKLRADQAMYSQERKEGTLEKPRGQLFQAGVPVYNITADRAQVGANGDVIKLLGKVEATDLRQGAVIRADEAEWGTKTEVLLLHKNLAGGWQDLQMTAQEGRWESETNQLQLSGLPVVMTSAKQRIKLQSEQFLWQIKAQHLASTKPVEIQRFLPTTPPAATTSQPAMVPVPDATSPTSPAASQTLIGKANGQELEGDLQKNWFWLKGQAKVVYAQPSLEIASDRLRWEVQSDRIVSETPLTLIDHQNKLTASANQGNADLVTKMLNLLGNVKVLLQVPPSDLGADRVQWAIDTQEVEAEGNVRYIRNSQPPIDVSGPKASGNLKQETVTITGGRSTTTVIPIFPTP
jgi:LPS export ABC transporter protein LptC